MGTQRSARVLNDAAAHPRRARFTRKVYKVAAATDNAWLRALDAGIVVAAWTLAYVAGFEGRIPTSVFTSPLLYLGVPLAIQLAANQIFGLYGPVWRYASVQEAVRVVGAIGAGAVLSAFCLAATGQITDTQVPFLTAPAVAALLMLLGCGGVRFQSRLFALERQERRAERVRVS